MSWWKKTIDYLLMRTPEQETPVQAPVQEAPVEAPPKQEERNDTPASLAYIAERDVNRFAGGIIKHAGLSWEEAPTEHHQEAVGGTGPVICITQGYEAFKASYLAAEDAIRKTVKEHAQPGDILLVSCWVQQDEDRNYLFVRHIWRLMRKP